MDKLAAITNPALNSSISGLTGVEYTQNIISALIGIGLVIGGVVFLFMLIVGGIQWIASGSDKASYEAARSRITSALVGILLLFGIFGILNLVNCFFGIGLGQIDIGPYQVSFSGAICPGEPSPFTTCGQIGDPCSATTIQCCQGLSCVDHFCQ